MLIFDLLDPLHIRMQRSRLAEDAMCQIAESKLPFTLLFEPRIRELEVYCEENLLLNLIAKVSLGKSVPLKIHLRLFRV